MLLQVPGSKVNFDGTATKFKQGLAKAAGVEDSKVFVNEIVTNPSSRRLLAEVVHVHTTVDASPPEFCKPSAEVEQAMTQRVGEQLTPANINREMEALLLPSIRVLETSHNTTAVCVPKATCNIGEGCDLCDGFSQSDCDAVDFCQWVVDSNCRLNLLYDSPGSFVDCHKCLNPAARKNDVCALMDFCEWEQGSLPAYPISTVDVLFVVFGCVLELLVFWSICQFAMEKGNYSVSCVALLNFAAAVAFNVGKFFPAAYGCKTQTCRKLVHNCVMTMSSIPFDALDSYLLFKLEEPGGPNQMSCGNVFGVILNSRVWKILELIVNLAYMPAGINAIGA